MGSVKIVRKKIKKQEIKKDTLLKDILEIKGASEILSQYRLPCLSCPLATFELGQLTLEDVCHFYKIDLEKLLQELKTKLIKN
jgi:hybrid cluster-associated redox disulfide protein